MARAVKDVYYGKTLRKSFARSEEILEMPYLLEIQKKSYKWFFETGLQEVFDDVDTITDYAGNLELSFIGFSMDDPPKYTIEECKAQDATYAKPIKVQVRLRNKETGEIKEQEKMCIRDRLGEGHQAGVAHAHDLLAVLRLPEHLQLVGGGLLYLQGVGHLGVAQMLGDLGAHLGGVAVDGLLAAEDHVEFALGVLHLPDGLGEDVAGGQGVRPAEGPVGEEIGLVRGDGHQVGPVFADLPDDIFEQRLGIDQAFVVADSDPPRAHLDLLGRCLLYTSEFMLTAPYYFPEGYIEGLMADVDRSIRAIEAKYKLDKKPTDD